MNLSQKDTKDLQGRRRTIENELNRMIQQIHEMDQKIRLYLADRQRNAHPRHIEFIERIQRYRIDPHASNKHLEALLDNLQWKIYYYQRAWNQMWENSDSSYRQTRNPELETPPAPSGPSGGMKEVPKTKSQYSIETLWEVQVERLKQYGAQPKETPTEFRQRMYQEYKELSKFRKDHQEVVMVYDAKDQKCKLDLKDK
ncbi:MAG: hypothetical protein MUE70_04760 [Desulfobacterales bacterium]|nr:hypothetical protein [Desulfobacterales bacterium]